MQDSKSSNKRVSVTSPAEKDLFSNALVQMKIKPKIPESLFRSKYLSSLINPSETKRNVTLWVIEVAKNYYSEVDVFKDGDPDDILFTVPPAMDNSVDLSVVKTPMTPIDRAAARYRENAPINNMLADNTFKNALIAQSKALGDIDIGRHADNWKKMLSYYNIPVLNGGSGNKVDSSIFDSDDDGKF